MAHVDIDLLASLLTGSINNELTIYKRGGKLIVAKKRGPSKKQPSDRQLAVQKRMKAAVRYAKYAMEDPELKKRYQKMAGPGQNAFNMAVSAYFADPHQVVEPATTARIVRRTVRRSNSDRKLKGPVMVMSIPMNKVRSD